MAMLVCAPCAPCAAAQGGKQGKAPPTLQPSVATRASMLRPGIRVDVLRSDRTLAQAGGELGVDAGRSLRLALVGAAGVARRAGSDRASGRVEITTRFLLDPDARHRWGAYAVAGGGALYDGARWRGILSLSVGMEHRVASGGGGPRPFVELGLGGGVRLGGGLRWRLGRGKR